MSLFTVPASVGNLFEKSMIDLLWSNKRTKFSFDLNRIMFAMPSKREAYCLCIRPLHLMNEAFTLRCFGSLQKGLIILIGGKMWSRKNMGLIILIGGA